MRSARSFVRAATVLGLVLVVLLAGGAAFAQEESPPVAGETAVAEPKGLCTPWHRCLAITTGGVVLLWLLSAAGMYALQRRGFDTLEHRQGSPGGVPVSKE